MTLRHATQDDARFIALVVMEALGDDIMERVQGNALHPDDEARIDRLADVARREDTLYSWRHTLVAEDADGTLLGAMVAYSGDEYMAMRQRTFDMLSEQITFDIAVMEAETLPGEYYLDSLAVSPLARGKGVGRRLLGAARDAGFALSRPAILACAPDNLNAKALYENMGFREEGDMFIFGHQYLRMVARGK